MNEELINTLRSFGKAYPEDVFKPLLDKEIKDVARTYPVFIDRNSAAMGRHCAKFMTEAADALDLMVATTQFVSVDDRLPEEKITDGSVNCVLAVWKKERLDGCIPNPNICNVTYFNLHVDEFTHWMYSPSIPQ
jgi:hypothetical protein